MVAENVVEQPEDINLENPDEGIVEDEEAELTKEEKMAAIPTLLAEGTRALVVNNFDVATDKLALATEYAVSVYEDPFAPECFEPHYKYGRALASLAELEAEDPQEEFNTVKDYISKMTEERVAKLQGPNAQPNLDDSRVGHAEDITGEERIEIIAAVDAALEENAEELEKLAEKAADEVEEKKETPEADAQDEEADESEVQKADDEEVAEMEEDSEEDDDEDSNKALAWEVLQIARKCCEKQGESKEWDLKKAKVLSYLGQLSLLDEKLEDAIADFAAAHEINQKYLDPNDRCVASSFCDLANAYKHNDDYLRASELFKSTIDILTSLLEQANGSGDTEEIKDLDECLRETTSKYEDCLSSYKDAESKKAMEQKEAKQISPEKPKENDAPVSDISSNIRKGKRAADDAAVEDEAKKSKIEEPTEAVTDTVEPVV